MIRHTRIVTNKKKVLGFSHYFKRMLNLAHYYYYDLCLIWLIFIIMINNKKKAIAFNKTVQ